MTIVSSFGDLEKAAVEKGHNADCAAYKKNEKYFDLCRQHNLKFSPFVMETVGGFHPSCAPILDHISIPLAQADRMSKEAAKRQLVSRISYAWNKNLAVLKCERFWEEDLKYAETQLAILPESVKKFLV